VERAEMKMGCEKALQINFRSTSLMLVSNEIESQQLAIIDAA